MGRLFISHAVADKDLVEAFVSLLQTGMDISQKDIFCSCVDGMKPRPGKGFVEYIRKQLSSADYVIMLITPAYYESAFCLCELGGSWVQAKDAYPLLVPPIKYDNLKAVLHGVQCGNITDSSQLSQLFDCLTEIGIVKASATRWEVKRDEFLKALPRLLKKLQPQSQVSAVDHKAVQKKYDEAQEMITEKNEEIEALKDDIEELKKLKNKEDVKKVGRKRQSEREQFDALTAGVREFTDKLPDCVVEVMFRAQNGKKYYPSTDWGNDEEWSSLRSAKDRGLITIDGNHVELNTDDPKVSKALAALEDLAEFLGSARDETIDEITNEFEFICSLTVRDFWEKFLGLS